MPGGGLPLPGLYPGSMAGMLAQFGHDSGLLGGTSMMPPNIPHPVGHDLSNATADEVLEAAGMVTMAGQLANLHHSLKRPSHTSYDTNSDMDFDLKSRADSLDSSGRPMPKKSRPNHSLIEKRRRDKMKAHIHELAALVPMCAAINTNKLDKFTVLRLALQHIKSLLGSARPAAGAASLYKPAFVSDEELKQLMQYSGEGFVLVAGCDRARVLFTSNSTQEIVQHNSQDLLGRSLFDLLHPEDAETLKTQLLTADHGPRERLIDIKTGVSIKTESSPSFLSSAGSRRSFFCRMKSGRPCGSSPAAAGPSAVPTPASATQLAPEKSEYINVQISGYIRTFPSSQCIPTCLQENGKIKQEEGTGSQTDQAVTAFCGIVRPVTETTNTNSPSRDQEFVIRLTPNGRILDCDERIKGLLELVPQEVIGTSLYDHLHRNDIPRIVEVHRAALQSRNKLLTSIFRLRRKDGEYVAFRAKAACFRNPLSKKVEQLVFCVAVVEPAERDIGRKLIRDCPAQEALQDFLQSEGGNGSSAGSVSTNCRSPSGVSKLGDLVAQELQQREADRDGSGRISQSSPPNSPKIKMPEGAPASNESGYKSSPNPSDPDNLSFSIPNVDSICQENELIRQGVQQLQNKINQFQRRDGLGGSPLPLTDDSMGMVMSILEADSNIGDPFNGSLIRA